MGIWLRFVLDLVTLEAGVRDSLSELFDQSNRIDLHGMLRRGRLCRRLRLQACLLDR